MRKKLLHVGCGPKGVSLPHDYAGYEEVRLDVSRAMEPDIVASCVAMPMIEDESFDAIFCSHCLEHLYAHEVPHALAEFLRVLKVDGLADIRVPDLQSIGGRIGLGDIDQVLYMSPAGPITALDMLYGLRPAIANGHTAMAHKTGFTEKFLCRRLEEAGFAKVVAYRVQSENCPEIRAVAIKGESHVSEQDEETSWAKAGSSSFGRDVPEDFRIQERVT